MGAVFSTDRRCRYLLDRDLGGSGPVMSIGMINPSIANEDANDPTVTRVVGFGQRLGASKVIAGISSLRSRLMSESFATWSIRLVRTMTAILLELCLVRKSMSLHGVRLVSCRNRCAIDGGG